MQLPNKIQLNLILDILLDLFLDCYILWNMKKLIIFKLCISLKKILDALNVKLLDYFYNENALLKEYVEREIFALKNDNNMKKQVLKNKDQLIALSPTLIADLSYEFEQRNKLKKEIAKAAEDYKKQSEQGNAKNTDESKELKLNN